MSHKCQDKKQPAGTNQQRHQTHVQDNSQIMNPVQTPDEASLSITPRRNSHAGILIPQQFHASKPWTLVSAPLAVTAGTFENLSLHHYPPWLILFVIPLPWWVLHGRGSSLRYEDQTVPALFHGTCLVLWLSHHVCVCLCLLLLIW